MRTISPARPERLRSCLAGLGAAALALASPFVLAQQQAACTQPAPVRLQTFEGNIINMQAVVAVRQGLLQKHCLAATLVPIANTPLAVTATMNGTVDFINSGTDNIVAARAQGIKLRIVANIAERAIYSLVVRKEHVKATHQATLEALRGKKIGVVAVGASNEHHARLHFTEHGMQPTAVTYIGLGGTAAMLAALEKGTVDAVEFFGTAQDIAAAKGFGVVVSDARKPGGPQNPVPKAFEALAPTSLVWAAQESWLTKNPDSARRFAAAMHEASEWIRQPANRPKLYELMKDQFVVPADVANAQQVYRTAVDTYAGMTSAKLAPKALKAYVDFATQARALKAPVPVSDIVWEDRR